MGISLQKKSYNVKERENTGLTKKSYNGKEKKNGIEKGELDWNRIWTFASFDLDVFYW